MNIEEKLYTSTEVAEVLGVSLRSVYRYLEQGKLDAEIKTATGRLRFTKKNITDFLYPRGGTSTQPQTIPDISSPTQALVQGQSEPHTVEGAKSTPSHGVVTSDKSSVDTFTDTVKEETSQPEKVVEETPAPKSEPKIEPAPEQEIDWLSKFKAAAQEVQEEPTPTKTPTPGIPEKKDSISFLASTEKDEKASEVSFKYYKSMLGGLKEIAQNIDKVGRKSGVDYAFTLHAGLSLEKPLKKPFSVLHAYVNPSTEPLFKRMLQLEETDTGNGQLCLMFTESTSIFANKVEKHGLFVVSSEQIEEDFKLLGLGDELAS